MSPLLYHMLADITLAQLLKTIGEERGDGLLDAARPDSHEIDSRGLTMPRLAGPQTVCSFKEVPLPRRTYTVKSIGFYKKDEKCKRSRRSRRSKIQRSKRSGLKPEL